MTTSRDELRAISRNAGMPPGVSNPPPESPIGQWLAALSLHIGSPDEELSTLAGYIIRQFGEPFPVASTTGDYCPHCGHPWRAHGTPRTANGPDGHPGCDAFIDARRTRTRCGCRSILVPTPIGDRLVPPRPTLADNPGDSLAAVQALYDRAETILARLEEVLAELDTGEQEDEPSEFVYLARVYNGAGAERIVGSASTRERGLAMIGLALVNGTDAAVRRAELIEVRHDVTAGVVTES